MPTDDATRLFPPIVLGSRSPRRLELLSFLVPRESIRVLPPDTADEPDFAGLHSLGEIRARLAEIARLKSANVLKQLRTSALATAERPVVVCADTTIIAADGGGSWQALGLPEETDDWRETVRGWFRELYAGRTHRAATGLFVATPDGREIEQIVETRVTFRSDVEPWLEWYLQTGEPLGKAGGYALQGAGSLFVTHLEGSQSNVIGLPLEALLEIFAERLGFRNSPHE